MQNCLSIINSTIKIGFKQKCIQYSAITINNFKLMIVVNMLNYFK